MTLLDRFRTPTRHKDPNPAVRLAYVDEIPLDERELIREIAHEDDNARVRLAAVSKLMDPAALGSIARDDRDEDVRRAAVTMLRDIALEAFEGTAESDSLDAVDTLANVRVLAQIAKTSSREIVALRALSRVGDLHSLGSIARHAALEPARRGAFERLRERADHSEMLAVAMNSEYKDTALAALDLVTDRAELEQIAARSKNKSAAKRARVIIRKAHEVAESSDAPAVRLQPGRNEDSIVPPQSDGEGAKRVALQAETDVAPPPFDLKVERIRAEEAERMRAAQQARRHAEEQAEAQAREVEERRARELARRHGRLAELVEAAEAAAADADLTSARKRLGIARHEWKDLTAAAAGDEALAGRFGEAESQVVVRETEAREADARARREALACLQHLIDRVAALATQPNLSLRAAWHALREVRTALAAISPLPTRQDYEDVTRRLKAVQAVLVPKLQELRETDEWQRWANVGVQEQLCAKMEALRALEDPEAIAREVHVLQEQWRTVADVPRAPADRLWRRFKAAHDEAWARCEAHFAAEARTRAENLARKTAFCEKAESLADSTNWIQTADEIKCLQAEWKTIGPVSHGREKAVWDRFRAAGDRFFTRRHEDLARRKQMWAENLARKEALYRRAEALAESTDWESAAAETRRLQAEWKTIGSVRKTRSEAIWQRFHGACDHFFLRYGQRHELARAERIAAREAICAELAALAPDGQDAASADPATPPPDLLAKVRALLARWQQEVLARGVDPGRAQALDRQFAAAFARVSTRWHAAFAGSDLDLEANRKRMDVLARRMEDLATSVAGPSLNETARDLAFSPSTRLAAMLKEALAATTIGGTMDEDSRLKAAAEEVRRLQASWSRLGLVSDEARRLLTERFQRACRRITERTDRAGAAARPTRSIRPTGS